jgi:hypothetical protein
MAITDGEFADKRTTICPMHACVMLPSRRAAVWQFLLSNHGAPEGIRTSDLCLRRTTLRRAIIRYPTRLSHKILSKLPKSITNLRYLAILPPALFHSAVSLR